MIKGFVAIKVRGYLALFSFVVVLNSRATMYEGFPRVEWINSKGVEYSEPSVGSGLDKRLQGDHRRYIPGIDIDRTTFPKPSYQLEMDLYLFSVTISFPEEFLLKFDGNLIEGPEVKMRDTRRALKKWSRSKDLKEVIRAGLPSLEMARESAMFPVLFNIKSIGFTNFLGWGSYTYPKFKRYEVESSVRVIGLSHHRVPGHSTKVSKIWVRPVLRFDEINSRSPSDGGRIDLPFFELPISSLEIVSGYDLEKPIRLKDEATLQLQEVVREHIEREFAGDKKAIKFTLSGVVWQGVSITLVADNYKSDDPGRKENVLLNQYLIPMNILGEKMGVIGSTFLRSKEMCLRSITGRMNRL